MSVPVPGMTTVTAPACDNQSFTEYTLPASLYLSPNPNANIVTSLAHSSGSSDNRDAATVRTGATLALPLALAALRLRRAQL